MYSEDINKSIYSQAMQSFVINRLKLAYTLLIIGFIVMFFWVTSSTDDNNRNPKISAIHQDENLLRVYNLKKRWILNNCLETKFQNMSLEFLPEYIEKLEKSLNRDCK